MRTPKQIAPSRRATPCVGAGTPCRIVMTLVSRTATDVDRLEMRLDLTAESVRQARHEVAEFARRHELADPDDVALAVSEAATNAVLHAHRGDPTKGMRVVACARETGLVVVVRDYGVGMSPNPEQPGARPRPLGHRRPGRRGQHRAPGRRWHARPHPVPARRLSPRARHQVFGTLPDPSRRGVPGGSPGAQTASDQHKCDANADGHRSRDATMLRHQGRTVGARWPGAAARPVLRPARYERRANAWHCACGRSLSGAAIAARGRDFP